MSERPSPAQSSVLRRLVRGWTLRCESVTRTEPLYWLNAHGRRQRGPGWGTVEAMERRDWLDVGVVRVYGVEEIQVTATILAPDADAA